MADLTLENGTNGVMDALYGDKGLSSPQKNDRLGYGNLIQLFTGLGIDPANVTINLSGSQTLGEGAKVIEAVTPLLTSLGPAISEMLGTDASLREHCSAAKETDGIRLQSTVPLTSTQKVNIEKDNISLIQTAVLEDIAIFFLTLGIQMEQMKRKREQKENVIGTTNISKDLITILGAMALAKLKESIAKGFTLLGIAMPDDFNLDSLISKEKELDEQDLGINALETLRHLKELAEQARLGNEQQLDQGYPRKMKPSTQRGFISSSSLLVYIGILFTIIEFILIFISIK